MVQTDVLHLLFQVIHCTKVTSDLLESHPLHTFQLQSISNRFTWGVRKTTTKLHKSALAASEGMCTKVHRDPTKE